MVDDGQRGHNSGFLSVSSFPCFLLISLTQNCPRGLCQAAVSCRKVGKRLLPPAAGLIPRQIIIRVLLGQEKEIARSFSPPPPPKPRPSLPACSTEFSRGGEKGCESLYSPTAAAAPAREGGISWGHCCPPSSNFPDICLHSQD